MTLPVFIFPSPPRTTRLTELCDGGDAELSAWALGSGIGMKFIPTCLEDRGGEVGQRSHPSSQYLFNLPAASWSFGAVSHPFYAVVFYL